VTSRDHGYRLIRVALTLSEVTESRKPPYPLDLGGDTLAKKGEQGGKTRGTLDGDWLNDGHKGRFFFCRKR